MRFTEHYKINFHDTDLNGIVSTSGILRYMQDAANLQMIKETPSYDELFNRGYAFILSRIRLSIYSPIYAHDEIGGQSWACESRGVSFNRCYRILKNDSIAAEAASVWALVNRETGRVCRVKDVELNYSIGEMLELDFPNRFKLPPDIKLSLVGEHTAVYAEIDKNMHINNTKYADILCGYLPDMRGKRVSSFEISYLSEAPLGDTLKVYCGEYDGLYYFRTIRADGKTNIEAEIMLEDI